MLLFICLIAASSTLQQKSVRVTSNGTIILSRRYWYWYCTLDIDGEDLDYYGNLSSIITEEHISAREARLVFDTEKQIKFTADMDERLELPMYIFSVLLVCE